MVFYNCLVRMSLTPTLRVLTGERARWHREPYNYSQKDLTTPSSGSQSNGRATQLISSHLGLGPGHTKDFFGVLAKTRGIFPGFHDIRGRRQIFRAAFSSYPASEWMRSGVIIISAAFHGM